MLPEQKKEFNFTREDFDYLRKIVTELTGILASEDKYTLYYSRLARRVRRLGLKDFSEYRKYLDSNRDSEIIELVNSVTTNLTSFFRENHHFEFIRDHILPDKIKQGDRKLRIWSAGCSTGEEPYSIAMTLAETIPDYRQWDIQILATDLDSQVLRHASTGVYDESRIKGIEAIRLQRFFIRDNSQENPQLNIQPELQRLITFKQLNLLHHWPIHDKIDFIFCRNVVIYFDKVTKDQLVDRFADHLTGDGYLFMGHSESLFRSSERFKLLGQTIYQKSDGS